MKAVVIGAAGHIGTYLVPMLVKAGFETVAVTRTMSAPYEKDYAWSNAERVLLDRSKDVNFVERLKAMNPDIIVDLVNFDIQDTQKIVQAFQSSNFRILQTEKKFVCLTLVWKSFIMFMGMM